VQAHAMMLSGDLEESLRWPLGGTAG
jgi:hypothetical protein